MVDGGLTLLERGLVLVVRVGRRRVHEIRWTRKRERVEHLTRSNAGQLRTTDGPERRCVRRSLTGQVAGVRPRALHDSNTRMSAFLWIGQGRDSAH